MKVRALLVMFAMLGSALPAFAEHGAASISGTVTNPQGEPVVSICVIATDTEWETSYEASTDEDGSYSIDVSTGEWLVGFYDCGEGGYLEQWYDGKTSWWNADPLPVSPDEHVTDIDAVMSRGGSITGTISTEDVGWADVSVYAWGQDGGWGSAQVDVDGSDTYTITGLPAGNYTVQFQTYSSGYVAEFYDDASDEVDATLVPVAGEQVTEGIDAELTAGGSIAGRVMDDEGFAVNGACVDAYRPDGQWVSYGDAYDDGRYEVRGLPTGAYKVQISDCGEGELASEWYEDASTAEDATEVSVVATEVTRGIDAVLARGSGPDISIDRVWVTPVPLETDLASLPGTGLHRTVHALVSNRGNEGGEAPVYASATSVTDYKTRRMSTQRTRVKPGETVELTFAWNGAGMVGDALIKVLTCPERDTRWRNNTATTRSYVGVGGTGSGYTLAGQTGSEPECWGEW